MALLRDCLWLQVYLAAAYYNHSCVPNVCVTYAHTSNPLSLLILLPPLPPVEVWIYCVHCAMPLTSECLCLHAGIAATSSSFERSRPSTQGMSC